jgi:hypothetical protein
MNELSLNTRSKERTTLTKNHRWWSIAFVAGWSFLLFLVLPFSAFPLAIRLGVTIVSLYALYVLMRSMRGWHCLWAIPLVLFLLSANYGIWSCPNWTAAYKKRAFEERRPTDHPNKSPEPPVNDGY